MAENNPTTSDPHRQGFVHWFVKEKRLPVFRGDTQDRISAVTFVELFDEKTTTLDDATKINIFVMQLQSVAKRWATIAKILEKSKWSEVKDDFYLHFLRVPIREAKEQQLRSMRYEGGKASLMTFLDTFETKWLDLDPDVTVGKLLQRFKRALPDKTKRRLLQISGGSQSAEWADLREKTKLYDQIHLGLVNEGGPSTYESESACSDLEDHEPYGFGYAAPAVGYTSPHTQSNQEWTTKEMSTRRKSTSPTVTQTLEASGFDKLATILLDSSKAQREHEVKIEERREKAALKQDELTRGLLEGIHAQAAQTVKSQMILEETSNTLRRMEHRTGEMDLKILKKSVESLECLQALTNRLSMVEETMGQLPLMLSNNRTPAAGNSGYGPNLPVGAPHPGSYPHFDTSHGYPYHNNQYFADSRDYRSPSGYQGQGNQQRGYQAPNDNRFGTNNYVSRSPPLCPNCPGEHHWTKRCPKNGENQGNGRGSN
jgi:hypothetical protein